MKLKKKILCMQDGKACTKDDPRLACVSAGEFCPESPPKSRSGKFHHGKALFGSAAEDGDCSTCCAENSNSRTRSSLKSPRDQHAQRDGRHGQPCLQTLLVLRPITLSATAAVSNRRPLTHEGASKRRDDLFPISAGRAPAADLPPTQPRIMIQRTEGGSPGDKAAEGGDSHGCFIGIASYYSLMAGGGRHQ